MASIIQVNGKWRATVRVMRDGKSVLNRSKSFDREKDAKIWAAKFEAEVADKGPDAFAKSSPAQSIGRIIERYVSTFDTPAKPFGDTKRICLRILAESELGQISAIRLQPSDLIAFAHRLLERVGPATVYQYLSYLRIALKTAPAAFGIEANHYAIDSALTVLKQNGQAGQGKERDRRLLGDEYQRILDWLTDYDNRRSKNPVRHADIFRFAVASAFRMGEILRIQWSDVDYDKRTVVIRDRKDPKRKIGNHQTVPLLGDAWLIIAAQAKADALIFPINQNTVQGVFGRCCDALGIVDLHFHDLRHEGISRMFEAGYQIQEVAILSGHKTWNMLRRYTQIKPESLHRD